MTREANNACDNKQNENKDIGGLPWCDFIFKDGHYSAFFRKMSANSGRNLKAAGLH